MQKKYLFILLITSFFLLACPSPPESEPENPSQPKDDPVKKVEVVFEGKDILLKEGIRLVSSGDFLSSGSTLNFNLYNDALLVFVNEQPLCFWGKEGTYVIPDNQSRIEFKVQVKAISPITTNPTARAIFVGNSTLPVGENNAQWNFSSHIKEWFTTGSSTRLGNNYYDMQWVTENRSDLLLNDFFKSEEFGDDFAKNPHAAVCSFGIPELTAENFNAELFQAQYAAVLSSFQRARSKAVSVAVTLPPLTYFSNVTQERWTAVDKAIRGAALQAKAFLVDLTQICGLENADTDVAFRQRKVAEEIFLSFWSKIEDAGTPAEDMKITTTPQQKWTSSGNDSNSGNQDVAKRALLETINNSDRDKPQVLFVGDSITDFYDGTYEASQRKLLMSTWWNENVGWSNSNTLDEDASHSASKYRAVNLGNSGDFTQSLLYRFTKIEGDENSGAYTGTFQFANSVKAIVLNIGTNNCGPHTKNTINGRGQERPISSIETYRGIKAVVELLKSKFPNSKIILMGLFPRGQSTTTSKIDFIRLQVLSVNRLLRDNFSNDERILYTDIYEKFITSNGTQKTGTNLPALGSVTGCTTLFFDTLHPNNAGYKIWWDSIQPLLDDCLK